MASASIGGEPFLSNNTKTLTNDAHEQRERLRKWLTILTIFPLLNADDFSRKLPNFWTALLREPLDSNRAYGEWAVAKGILTFQREKDISFILEKLLDYNHTPATAVSLLTIVTLIGSNLPKDSKLIENFFTVIFPRLLPWFMHNNHRARLYSLNAFNILWNRQSNLRMTLSTEPFSNMAVFLAQSEGAARFLQKIQSQNDHLLLSQNFDVNQSFTIQYLYGVMPAFHSERISKYSFMNVDEAFGNISFGSEDDQDIYLLNSFPSFQQTAAAASASASAAPSSTNPEEDETSAIYSKVFQRKTDPWDLKVLDRDLVGEVMRRKELDRKTDGFDTILIASLLDLTPNIAGLSRTAEVFGARQMTVSDLSITSSIEFQKISVTSERWLDIIEVGPSEILHFLLHKKAKGYRVLALEQTCRSVSLMSFNFVPGQQTCLIIGNERDGIPVELLHIVDECIEIPQFGMIRSLNAHVAGAILLWEARKQTHKPPFHDDPFH